MALITRDPLDINRKVKATALAGIIAPLIAGWLATRFPNLSQACGGELSAFAVAWATTQGATLLSTVTGYFTRDRATT